jgi:hypothetical protein
MPVLGLALVALLVWLFVRRKQPVESVAVRAGVVCAVALIAAALAVRGGPAATGAVLLASAAGFALWLRMRGAGGDDPGDGPDPPDEPEPDPGPTQCVDPPVDLLDAEAFDRARAEWERELPRRD